MTARPRVPGLNADWADRQLDLLDAAEGCPCGSWKRGRPHDQWCPDRAEKLEVGNGTVTTEGQA